VLECATVMAISPRAPTWCPASEARPPCSTLSTSFGSERGTSNSTIQVPLYELKLLNEIAASGVGASTRRHWSSACAGDRSTNPIAGMLDAIHRNLAITPGFSGLCSGWNLRCMLGKKTRLLIPG
jgi:hypothetical protein